MQLILQTIPSCSASNKTSLHNSLIIMNSDITIYSLLQYNFSTTSFTKYLICTGYLDILISCTGFRYYIILFIYRIQILYFLPHVLDSDTIFSLSCSGFRYYIFSLKYRIQILYFSLMHWLQIL